jgi:hypothetical protein
MKEKKNEKPKEEKRKKKGRYKIELYDIDLLRTTCASRPSPNRIKNPLKEPFCRFQKRSSDTKAYHPSCL